MNETQKIREVMGIMGSRAVKKLHAKLGDKKAIKKHYSDMARKRWPKDREKIST